MNIGSAAILAMHLETAIGESLSEKLKTLNITDVTALESKRGYEVIIFTDDESCKNYGGLLAGQRIISPSGNKGTIKGAGFYEGDFRHGNCDPSGYTTWIAFDKDNGFVTCIGGHDGQFNLIEKGFILEC